MAKEFPRLCVVAAFLVLVLCSESRSRPVWCRVAYWPGACSLEPGYPTWLSAISRPAPVLTITAQGLAVYWPREKRAINRRRSNIAVITNAWKPLNSRDFVWTCYMYIKYIIGFTWGVVRAGKLVLLRFLVDLLKIFQPSMKLSF